MKLNDILETQFLIEMPREDALEAQKVLDSVLKKYMGLSFDLSYHFNQRVLDKGEKSNKKFVTPEYQESHGRESDVTKEELYKLFHKLITDKKSRGKILGAKQFGKEIEGIITDSSSDVNVVFKVAYQNRDKFPLFRVITLKRGKKFESRRPGDMRLYV